MAEKGFGVKEINLIGASGTPTITSPNNINLNAANVAISTNVSIGGTLTVTGNVSVGGTLTYEDVTNIDSVGVVTAREGVVVVGRGVSIAAGGLNVTAGISTLSGILKVMSGLDLQTNGTLDIIGSTSSSGLDIQSNASVQIGQNGFPNNDYATFSNTGVNLKYNNSTKLATSNTGVTVTGTLSATSFSGDGSALTGIAVTEAPVVDYTITGDGSHYYFHGGGVDETAGDPDLYLIRGQKYRFNNTTGSGHPFRFTSTGNANAAYSNGVTGSENGIQFWTIPYDAPAKLFYVCTIHSGMVGNIYIRGANGQNDNVGITTITGTTPTSAGHLLNLRATTGDNFIKFDNTSDNSEWSVGTDSTTRGKLDIWYDSNGSNYDLKFSVDGATGAVRKPRHPVFIAYRTSTYTLSSSAIEMVYNTEKIDVGSNYNPSNGRFTAPVDGLYEFAYASIAHNTNSVYRYDLRINGSQPYSPMTLELRIHNASSEYGTNGEYVCYVNMTAGQYASVYAYASTGSSITCYGDANYGYTYFRGRLIG